MKQFLALVGVKLKFYHVDNGHFADKGFQDDYTSSKQIITFCDVGSHRQNGIVEQKIICITLEAMTLLLHAKQMLPEYTFLLQIFV